MKSSTLHSSPFVVLGVSNRDDRKKIIDQAETRSLEISPESCQKAKIELTNPRMRLATEVAWLPGVSPRKASQLLEKLLDSPFLIRSETGLPTLAHCNLLAAAFDAIESDHPPEDFAEFIQEIAVLAEQLDPGEILRYINEDRMISGFPEVKAIDLVEMELLDRKRYYRSAIKDALNRLPPESLLDAITIAIESVTDVGEEPAPELMDELVDSYALEVQSILETEAATVLKLVSSVRDIAARGEPAISAVIDQLEKVVKNWDRFAQPIQVSAKARGIDHDGSSSLAYELRSLAIFLFNEHDQINQSKRLMQILEEVFAELPEFVERVEEDTSALSEIEAERAVNEVRKKRDEAEWARSIAFSADVGVLFKDTLSIGVSGIEWKGNRYSLESITAVRWGATRHSVNGIPTGTDYEIGFATGTGSISINLKKESTYSGFIESLWRAVCVRLMIEMTEALASGKALKFGDMSIEDEYVTLVKHKFIAADERIRLPWSEVKVWSDNGEFIVGAKNDKKTYGTGSYKDNWNIHLLDYVVRSSFKKGITTLSDFFKT